MAEKKEYERVHVVYNDDDNKDGGYSEEIEESHRYKSEWEIFDVVTDDLKLHVQTSLMHQATKDDEDAFLKHIGKLCDSSKDLDIYQYLAFESTLYDPLNIRQVWEYRRKSFKAIICSLTQISAVIIILYQLLETAQSADKGVCNNYGSHGLWYMNILAFLVSMHFSFSILTKLNLSKGLNKYTLLIGYNVKWIDHGWLYYGCFVNTLVSVLNVWCCFGVVFYSESALSMTFAVVTLWYIAGLDDAMVTSSEYNQLKNGLRTDFKGRDKKAARFTSRSLGSGICCDLLEKIFYVIFGIPFILVKYITIAATFVMPFYFLFCY